MEHLIQVVEGKGFYSTLVANEKYNAYLAEQVKIDKSDIEEIIIDFNIRFNPELKMLMTRQAIFRKAPKFGFRMHNTFGFC